ncbi:MAG: hypothetical protein LQ338_001695 [Usnochroma carphineum]|nr:MAG: hypothetical protein LQ338_001695 [Usnochroma carphineum]
MQADSQLSQRGADGMASSTETSNSTPTLSNHAKKEIAPPSSAEPAGPTKTKPLDEDSATATLTGSLNDLTINGNTSKEADPEGGRNIAAKAFKVERADWGYHKYLCTQVKDVKDRPDAASVRAILFPENDTSPRFIWLKTNDTELDMDNINEKLEVSDILGVGSKGQIGQQQVTKNVRREFKPGMTPANAQAHLLLREECFLDGSKPNMSIGKVTKGNFQMSWRGPAVAVLTSYDDPGQSDTSAVIDDMTMTDYRDLIDFFAFYGQYVEGEEDFAPSSFWWLAPALKQELTLQPQVQVVKVSSDFEFRETGVKFSPFTIGLGHPAMAYLQPCPITKLLKFDLVIRRFPTQDAFRAEAEAAGNTNTGPNALLLCVDPKSKNWGTAPDNLTQGTVVVMRDDRQDLHPNHLEVIVMYLVNVIVPALQETLGPGARRERVEVLEMLHPGRFLWYYWCYKNEKSKRDDKWKTTPDPSFIGTDFERALNRMQDENP